MPTKMNPEIKAQWVAALRSGDYKQGWLWLRAGDRFCCLGVLCNLHAQAHPEIAAKETDPAVYMGAMYMPPDLVSAWAGLPLDKQISLSRMNDDGMSFEGIAAYIERTL